MTWLYMSNVIETLRMPQATPGPPSDGLRYAARASPRCADDHGAGSQAICNCRTGSAGERRENRSGCSGPAIGTQDADTVNRRPVGRRSAGAPAAGDRLGIERDAAATFLVLRDPMSMP